MAENVGSIEVDLIVNTKGLATSIKSGFTSANPAMKRAATDSGKAVSLSFFKGFSRSASSIKKLERDITKHLASIEAKMTSAGLSAGSGFHKGLTKGLRASDVSLTAFRGKTEKWQQDVKQNLTWKAPATAIDISMAQTHVKRQITDIANHSAKETARVRGNLSSMGAGAGATGGKGRKGGGGGGSSLGGMAAGAAAGMASSGRTGTMMATLPAAFIGKGMIDTMAEFEETLLRVQGTIGEFKGEQAANNMRDISNKARELGASTEFTASQVGEGFNFLAMTGLDAAQSLAVINPILDLATAETMEFGKAADMATNILNQFGLQTEDATELTDNMMRVTNVLSATTSSANTNIRQLGEAMKYLGPNANALGIDLESTAAMVGILGDAGIQGTLAGRALGSSFARLAKPTVKMVKTMKMLGNQIGKTTLSLYDGRGTVKDFGAFLGELEEATKGLSTAQKQGALVTMFGAEAFQEINVLLGKTSEGYIKYRTEITKTSKATDKAANKRQGLAFGIKEMKSAWDELALSIGDSGILENLTKVVKSITEAIRDMAETNPELLKTVTTFAAMAALAAPVMWLSGSVLKLIAGIAGGIGKLGSFAAGIKGVGIAAASANLALGAFGVAITGYAIVFAKMKLTGANFRGAVDKARNSTALLEWEIAQLRKMTQDPIILKIRTEKIDIRDVIKDEDIKAIQNKIQDIDLKMGGNRNVLGTSPSFGYKQLKGVMSSFRESDGNASAKDAADLKRSLDSQKAILEGHIAEITSLKKVGSNLAGDMMEGIQRDSMDHVGKKGMDAFVAWVTDATAAITFEPVKNDYHKIPVADLEAKIAALGSKITEERNVTKEARQAYIEMQAMSVIVARSLVENSDGSIESLDATVTSISSLVSAFAGAGADISKESSEAITKILVDLKDKQTKAVTQLAPAYAKAIKAVLGETSKAVDAHGSDLGKALSLYDKFKKDSLGITAEQKAAIISLVNSQRDLIDAGLEGITMNEEGARVLKAAGIEYDNNGEAVMFLKRMLDDGHLAQETFNGLMDMSSRTTEEATEQLAQFLKLKGQLASDSKMTAIFNNLPSQAAKTAKASRVTFEAFIKGTGKSAEAIKLHMEEYDQSLKKGERATSSFGSKGASEMERFAISVKESLKTPQQELDAYILKLQEAAAAGDLSPEQVQAATAKKSGELAGRGEQSGGNAFTYGQTDNFGGALSSVFTGGVTEIDGMNTKLEETSQAMLNMKALGVGAFTDIASAIGEVNWMTGDWESNLASVGGTILGSVITAIAQAASAWVAGEVTKMALGKTIQAQNQVAAATSMASGSAVAAAWLPAAWAMTVATGGTAAATGTAAFMGGLAVSTAAALTAGAISSVGGGLINAAAGATKQGGAYAMGGRPTVGAANVVGENGAELFVPDTSGRIIPNHDLQGGGGGGNVSVSVQNNLGVEADARVEESRGADGERQYRIIMNRLAGEIRSGKGVVGKSMKDSFGLGRGR